MESPIQVENGIPVPPIVRPAHNNISLTRPRKYPFYALEVGQSFLVPLSTTASLDMIRRRRQVISSMSSRVAKRLGWKFTIRLVASEGLRVWRIA